MDSKIFDEVLGCLKLESVCSVSVGPSSVQFVSKTARLTAITVCDFKANGSGTPRIYSTELLLAALSQCTFLEEIEGALKCTHKTDDYTLVKTIQPLLLDNIFYGVPKEWDTRITVGLDIFKKFINLQPEVETSIYLSNGILYFSCSTASCVNVIQISEIDILMEGTAKVTVYFSSLKYLSNLLSDCEKVSIMYTKEHFSIVLLFKDDIILHRVVFGGIM